MQRYTVTFVTRRHSHTSLMPILILLYYMSGSFSNNLFSLDCVSKILYQFLILFMRAASPLMSSSLIC
jgi:hypothetical protein